MRADVFGVPLDLLTMRESVEKCIELIETGKPAQHVVINAGKVVMMHDVPGLRSIVAGSAMVNADGQSIVWAGRLLGVRVPERVAGIDLMGNLITEAEARGWPVFFLGAHRAVLCTFVARVTEKHPDLVVAGFHDGYFADAKGIADMVRDSGARLLFVGISSPLKEFFLAEHLAEMGPVFAMGVGGSFDVGAGLTRRAPMWAQRLGLEWFYRLLQEPRRMWRRYLVGNTRFLVIVGREMRMKRPGRSRL